MLTSTMTAKSQNRVLDSAQILGPFDNLLPETIQQRARFLLAGSGTGFALCSHTVLRLIDKGHLQRLNEPSEKSREAGFPPADFS